MQYSSGLKARMIQRMSGWDPLSANKLSRGAAPSLDSLRLRKLAASALLRLAEGSDGALLDFLAPLLERRFVEAVASQEASTLSEDERGEFHDEPELLGGWEIVRAHRTSLSQVSVPLHILLL